MALYQLGSLQIKVAPFNAHEVAESGTTDYAVKAVVGAEQPLEFVGEGSNEMTLTGRLFPHEFGGLDELELLRQMRTSGRPQYLIRGDGKPFGWFAITSVSTRSAYLNSHGVGKMIEVTVNLRRAATPSKLSFFSLMQGLF